MKETKFKDTEICRIPEDWEIGKFEDVLCTFSAGATPYRGIADNFNGNIRWISSGELNYNTIFDTVEHISEKAVKNTHLTIHQPGTFLMAITGLEAAGTRGKCAFVGMPSTTNQSCLAINATDKMCTEYLFYFYRMFSDYLAFKYCQGTKQQSYTASIVRGLPIIYPKNVSEQSRIAAALTSIANLISSLDKLIEKKKNIKQGTMQQLLTGKIRLGEYSQCEVKYKDTEIGRIPEDWENVRIFDLAENYTGLTYSPDKVKEYGTIVLRSSNIKDGKLCYNDNVFVDMDIPERTKVKKNDILICVRNGSAKLIGKCAMIEEVKSEAAFGAFMTVLRSKDSVNPYFVYYVWQSNPLQKQIQDNLGATINQITNKDIDNFIVSIPPRYKEQSHIAFILSSMDNEIASLEAKKGKYERIKQGMMQQLLTGKIRLIG